MKLIKYGYEGIVLIQYIIDMSVVKVLSCCLKKKFSYWFVLSLLMSLGLFFLRNDVFGLIDVFINYINYLINLLKVFGTTAGETMY